MAQPAALGDMVLWNSTLADEQLPALVVQIPLYRPGGLTNQDAEGNPILLNLMVYSMHGVTTKYLVPHDSLSERNSWTARPSA